jgi:hypothetical protein
MGLLERFIKADPYRVDVSAVFFSNNWNLRKKKGSALVLGYLRLSP